MTASSPHQRRSTTIIERLTAIARWSLLGVLVYMASMRVMEWIQFPDATTLERVVWHPKRIHYKWSLIPPTNQPELPVSSGDLDRG